jgi:polar amino acid transport system substrate-binding protein
LLLCLACNAVAAELRLVSGDWHPYVDSVRATEAESLVSNLLMLDGDTVSWRYPGFYFAAEHLRQGTADAGFPFFRTAAREREFVFSAPIFEVDNVVIYNRRRHDLSAAPADLDDGYWRGYQIGIVAGYSYSGLPAYEALESVQYSSEQRALAGLLGGQIDLLPIERSVWRSLVLRHFPNQFYLIAEVPRVGWSEGVHLMMSANGANRARLDRFNARLAAFFVRNPDVDFVYRTSDIVGTIERGTAVLHATQLQPLIIGQLPRDDSFEPAFVIPEATSVIVTDWAESYFQHRGGVSVISQLQGLSRVLLIDGPHVGTEVYVRNAHIRIR